MKKFFAATCAVAALFSSCHNNSPKANLKSDIDTLSYEMGIVMSAEEKDFANMLTQQGSDSSYVDEFLRGYIDGMKSAEDKQKLAYNMGVQAGMQIKMQMPMMEQQVFQGDSTKKVSIKNFVAGFVAQAKGTNDLKVNGKLVDKKEANKLIMDYIFTKQRTEGEQFLAEKAKEKDVKKLADGILYKVIEAGQGDQHCTATDSVIVKYEGKLVNGTVFDSSEHAPGGTATLSLKQVIKGWQTALPQMPVGATWEIYLPYSQAYGEQGNGRIPPYSALVFKITLVGIAK